MTRRPEHRCLRFLPPVLPSFEPCPLLSLCHVPCPFSAGVPASAGFPLHSPLRQAQPSPGHGSELSVPAQETLARNRTYLGAAVMSAAFGLPTARQTEQSRAGGWWGKGMRKRVGFGQVILLRSQFSFGRSALAFPRWDRALRGHTAEISGDTQSG